jgi:hypothetical protein
MADPQSKGTRESAPVYIHALSVPAPTIPYAQRCRGAIDINRSVRRGVVIII